MKKRQYQRFPTVVAIALMISLILSGSPIYADTTSVNVSVVWNDGGIPNVHYPDSVTVQLINRLTDEIYSDPVVLNSSNNWEYEWRDLDDSVTYTVVGSAVDGYTYTVLGDATTGFIVNYTRTPVTRTVSAEIVWEDGDDQDGLRPDTVSLQLYAGGVASGSVVELGEDDSWTHSWQNLNFYSNYQEIIYTVEESGVPDGYTVVVSGDAGSGFTFTNTHVPETTSISVSKVWDDVSDQDGLRTDSVSVQLYADSVPSGSAVVLSEDNHWAYTWTNLDVYADGEKITYTVEETDVPDGYTCAISGDASSGFVVTNTHVPETTSVSVAKVWDDSSNQVGKRPDSVTVLLYADGEASGDAVVLNEENDWTYTWTDLDVYADGEEITYTVEETDVPDGYTCTVSGDSSSGFTITNTLVATPKTGDSMQAAMYSLLILASTAGVICIVYLKRKSVKKS
ncbi:MAG: Cna B-type domain-containing protein [Oscillospiraceae bacterium]|jgi:hypothetical protein